MGIELPRQHRRTARARQNVLAHPVAMCAHLRGEPTLRLLPALHAARAEEVRDAGHVAIAVVEHLLDLPLVGPQDAGVGALLEALARELRDRYRARHAGISADQSQRMRATLERVALVEQVLQRKEELARQIVER